MEDPQKGYIPPVYPLQQEDAYPPQQSGYNPPSYPPAPQAAQQSNTNVTVIQTQPQQVATVATNARRYGKNDKGLVYAIVASAIAFCCGGWIPLTCTIAAIFLALKAQENEDAGDEEKMKQFHRLSLVLSTVGIVAAVIIGVLSIVVVAIYYSTLPQPTSDVD